jgi:autophagy-related protein 5
MIWKGSVPVLFKLASEDVASMEIPLPLCLMLSRLTYLPLVASKVREHFESSAPPLEDELWFCYKNVPLKWNIPVGVLLDILLVLNRQVLPLEITVHFQAFPTDQLLRCKSLFTARSHYFNALKESLFLEYGSSQAIMGIPQRDLGGLWDAIAKPDETSGARWLSVRSTILSHVSAVSRRTVDECERLPVRLVVSGYGLGTPLQFACIQQPVHSDLASNAVQTLKSLCEDLFPGLVVDPSTGQQRKEIELLVQGTRPPLQTPLRWLCTNFSHPDFWLYVVIVVLPK